MGVEIERKFLVRGRPWTGRRGQIMRQGYLANQDGTTLRVRMVGDRATLTIKGPSQGMSRLEFEYQIPASDASDMLNQLAKGGLIEKTRYLIEHEGHCWEVDVFAGENAGLVVAEIELTTEEEVFARPSWLGLEVTQDCRYFNSALSRHPYSQWTRKTCAGEG